ncbi:Kinesin motor domain [Carpediemonas membranifera]|uniref:Kinesin-like protein n=1 Tax=Carpediemonas membranifera TaxID=201153 RepID=A0A8J6B3S3_9EUKA|nr:Kinesin motor domain [Carpediemonas membranifera]|eukprot:KAG9392327.1 Kinesin motor domain [Carpediemonas membranifera]
MQKPVKRKAQDIINGHEEELKKPKLMISRTSSDSTTRTASSNLTVVSGNIGKKISVRRRPSIPAAPAPAPAPAPPVQNEPEVIIKEVYLEREPVDTANATTNTAVVTMRDAHTETTLSPLEQQLASALEAQRALTTELHTTKVAMDSQRRSMLNTILELKGTYRVFCRIRPFTPSLNAPAQVDPDPANPIYSWSDSAGLGLDTVHITRMHDGATGPKKVSHPYKVDFVFPPDSKQEDVFLEVEPLVHTALDGKNVCIFAYGATSSGKTHTMSGTAKEPGIIPRTVAAIFEFKERIKSAVGDEVDIEVACSQIYNEKVDDLLTGKNAQTRKDRIDLTWVTIDSAEAITATLGTAAKNRATAATKENQDSSRSHAITQIRFTRSSVDPESGEKTKMFGGTLNLVDLAGSESAEQAKPTKEQPGQRSRQGNANESKNINLSLTNLKIVLNDLAQKSRKLKAGEKVTETRRAVGTRNSKLTMQLADALAGGRVLMIVNICPNPESLTLSRNRNALALASGTVSGM